MVVVADSSPLIAFAILERLDLLSAVYAEIVVPEAVYAETVASGKAHSTDLRDFLQGRVRAVRDRLAVQMLTVHVDAGEAEAIVLALERNVRNVLVDDAKARRYASHSGLVPIGTIGTLLRALAAGQEFDLKQYLDRLIAADYRISDALYTDALRRGDAIRSRN
jgi:uncharacterized protein